MDGKTIIAIILISILACSVTYVYIEQNTQAEIDNTPYNPKSDSNFNSTLPYIYLYNGTNGSNGINGLDGVSFNTTIPYIYVYNGTNGINGLDFNSTNPYVYVYNGTNGINGKDFNSTNPYIYVYNGTNGSNGLDFNTTGYLVYIYNGTNGSNGSNGINGLDFNATGHTVYLFNGTNGTNGVSFNQTAPYIYLYNGTNGSNGTNGVSFNQTAPYIYLYNGTNGSNGSNGSNGINGTNGTNGSNGFDAVSVLSFPVTIQSSSAEIQFISYTIPANTLNVGTTYLIKFHGAMSTYSTAPTLTITVRIGNVTSTNGNVTVQILPSPIKASLSYAYISGEFVLTVEATGANGAFDSSGYVEGNYGTVNGAFVFNGTSHYDYPAVCNTALNNLLELTGKFGTSNSANIFKCDDAYIELVKS